jgi:hypothetical protein
MKGHNPMRVSIAMILLLLQPALVRAQIVSPLDIKSGGVASEFFVGRQLGKPLVTVNLLNGVTRPGVYHVPQGTNIAQLIAYAGGAHPKANLAEISIQRNVAKKPQLVEVDLDKIIKSTSSFPEVRDSDVVHIDNDVVLDSTVKWVGLAATISSIAVSYFIIQDLRE